MYKNQMTIAEANSKSISDSVGFDSSDTLYMSADEWGEEEVGTLEMWENEIPYDEEEAKQTGWYAWYDNEKYETWNEFRDYLFAQLIEAEIVEDGE